MTTPKTKRPRRKKLGDCAKVHADLILRCMPASYKGAGVFEAQVRADILRLLPDCEMLQQHSIGLSSVALCHGLVSTDGVPPHFHAWIEFDVEIGGFGPLRLAHDRSNGNCGILPACLYRMAGRATDVREYCCLAVVDACRISGHYGPWVAKLVDNPL